MKLVSLCPWELFLLFAEFSSFHAGPRLSFLCNCEVYSNRNVISNPNCSAAVTRLWLQWFGFSFWRSIRRKILLFWISSILKNDWGGSAHAESERLSSSESLKSNCFYPLMISIVLKINTIVKFTYDTFLDFITCFPLKLRTVLVLKLV